MNPITKKIDECIAKLTPTTLEEGITSIKDLIESILRGAVDWAHFRNVSVHVYQDLEDQHQVMFMYTYQTPHSIGVETGVYRIDTRFWDCVVRKTAHFVVP
jgi:hypothetical protein